MPIGLWAACLCAPHCGRTPPRRLSVANVLRAFWQTLRDAVPVRRDLELSEQLKRAVLDDYPRKDKTSRGYPRKKQEHPAGAPKICNATPKQLRVAREIKHTERRSTA